jgi:exodeoxyribonuclease V alpha subunit
MVATFMDTTTIAASIARITYHAEDTGFCILQVEDDDFKTFTASGTMPTAKKGMQVQLVGEWKVHPKYGNQFNFISYSIPEPVGEKGAISFLSTLKGLGESTAKRIVETFGEKALKIIEATPDRLLEIKGIGKKSLPKIIASYEQNKGLQNLIAFLHELGVSAGYAPRIYKEYAGEAISTIRENPYVLAEQVRGFGFKKADEVALGLNVQPDSQVRMEAGISHVIKGSANLNGHCYLPIDELCTQVCEILALPDFRPQISDVESAIAALKNPTVKSFKRLVQDGENIYLHSFYEAEVGLAKKISAIAGSFQGSLLQGELDKWIADYEQNNGVSLASGQRAAICAAATNGMTVVTGGAGTGKSSVSKAVIRFWHDQRKRVIACAPTGKATQRIKEATGLESASTIHRLLGWSGNGFTHHKDNPIAGDAFLIDETSMVDLKLAYALFQAIPRHAVVMIVGDVNQLPSVGAGNVLRDVIESGQVPVVRLTEVFRQSATSRIIQASLSVNDGKVPDMEIIGKSSGIPSTDALWIKCSQEKIVDAIEWLVSEKLPDLGWSQDQVQVLAPMHKSECGNIALNKMIQQVWNGDKRLPEMMSFRQGDRVIQQKNDYDRKVFNGDIGKIEKIDLTEKEVLIRFPDVDNLEGRIVIYEAGDLEDLMLAYSISIHRSQGSEFPVVVIPASMQHYMMLQRNLLYTGITRGKKLVVIVGEEKAVQTAVRTQKINQRNTGLRDRLVNTGEVS